MDAVRERSELIKLVENMIASGEGPFCIVELDIDNFAQVNATYSTELGDDVIKKLASIMKQNFEHNNGYITRQGDQFTLLLANNGTERVLWKWRKYAATFPIILSPTKAKMKLKVKYI